MIIIKRDLGAVGVGVTSPRLMVGEDGHRYVVKLTRNKVGPKVLASEWLGFRLAKRIGLCVPHGEMVCIPSVLVKRSKYLRKMRADEGVHFGSRYLTGCEYVGRRVMRLAVNKDEVVGTMLFDHLFYNDDRTLNRKNFLARWDGRGWRIYAIDHSHLFGSGRWTEGSLLRRGESETVNARRAFGWLLRHYPMRETLSLYARRILSVTDDEVAEMIAEIPPAWLDTAERDVVMRFWQMRQRQAEEVAGRIADLAADIHRRTKRRVVK